MENSVCDAGSTKLQGAVMTRVTNRSWGVVPVYVLTEVKDWGLLGGGSKVEEKGDEAG